METNKFNYIELIFESLKLYLQKICVVCHIIQLTFKSMAFLGKDILKNMK